MIRSMTGYGEASSHEGGTHYFLDVRSLNNKYFKCVIRLPEDLQGLEAELESSLRRKLTRGAVTLMGRCSDTGAGATHTINTSALRRYLDQLRDANLEADGVKIDGAALLSLPGVLQPPADEEERLHRARAVMMRLLDAACEQLQQMRKREGEIVLRDLLEQRDVIMSRLDRVAQRAPQVVQEYEERLRMRINQLLEGSNLQVEPADLIREIAVYAERSDIAEELARLRGHMEQFAELLANHEDRPVGRTLDFLAQEMLREANTIASKSSDNAISRDIVEIKGAIDRIKEQIQNVE